MTSIITGDIFHSQKANPQIWLEKLKSELSKIGSNPETWKYCGAIVCRWKLMTHLMSSLYQP